MIWHQLPLGIASGDDQSNQALTDVPPEDDPAFREHVDKLQVLAERHARERRAPRKQHPEAGTPQQLALFGTG